MPDAAELRALGRLHADLALFEDAFRRSEAAAKARDDEATPPAIKPYWASVAERMAGHAAALGKALAPKPGEQHGGR